MKKIIITIIAVVLFTGCIKTTDFKFSNRKVTVTMGLSNGSKIEKEFELPKVSIKFGE